MATFEHTVAIRRPGPEVFDYLMCPENNLAWQPSLIAAGAVTDGPVRVGSRFWERRKVLGVPVEIEFEIEQLDPGCYCQTRAVSGPVPFLASYRVRPLGATSVLTAGGEVSDRALPRLAAKAAARTASRELTSNLSLLKQVLERPRVGATL
jgi:hypothetical protein